MTVLGAVETVLRQVGQPMGVKAITQAVLQQKLWTSSGKTPDQTIHAQIAVNIKKNPTTSRIERVGKGLFALRDGAPLPRPNTIPAVAPAPLPSASTVSAAAPASSNGASQGAATMTFTDAAETVLDQQTTHAPMHYKKITSLALQQGLNTMGLTPDATMYAQILTEIKRQSLKGQTPRFTKHGQGLVGLTKWIGSGLLAQIAQHNSGIAKDLHSRLLAMTSTEFETLVGTLLAEMGFAVTVTKPTADGGVDVYGKLAVGGTMDIKMAVQVKRWKNNVGSPEVQKLRGSLTVHDQGLLVTTSGFSKGAITEAQKPNAIPVGLIDGKELIALLMRHQIGVRQLTTPLYELEP